MEAVRRRRRHGDGGGRNREAEGVWSRKKITEVPTAMFSCSVDGGLVLGGAARRAGGTCNEPITERGFDTVHVRRITVKPYDLGGHPVGRYVHALQAVPCTGGGGPCGTVSNMSNYACDQSLETRIPRKRENTDAAVVRKSYSLR